MAFLFSALSTIGSLVSKSGGIVGDVIGAAEKVIGIGGSSAPANTTPTPTPEGETPEAHASEPMDARVNRDADMEMSAEEAQTIHGFHRDFRGVDREISNCADPGLQSQHADAFEDVKSRFFQGDFGGRSKFNVELDRVQLGEWRGG